MSTLQERVLIDRMWETEVMPALLAYMRIPCESPAFDPDWEMSGHLDGAAALLAEWASGQLSSVPGARVEIVRLEKRTPTIFIEIPGDGNGAMVIYGHLDKQPPMDGWTAGRSAWTPSLEGDCLYGRGGADDGYAIFSAILAFHAARANGGKVPRVVILIEACEESGSYDLPVYIEHLARRLGSPDLVVALDAYCGNYEQLWTTTSVRGQVAGVLSVGVLTEGVHSGDASGAIPSSFRIATHLMSRLENPATGEITPPAFHAEIPEERRREAGATAHRLGGSIFEKFPRTPGLAPVAEDMAELALNCTWRAQLTVTGLDGLPSIAGAAAVMTPAIALKLSLRLPPPLDPDAAADELISLLQSDPPYGATVGFEPTMRSRGWHAPPMPNWLSRSLDEGSRYAFGAPCAQFGGGGGIPFLAMLGDLFPRAQFVVTGVLGPGSNAHGPNEFLHLPTVKRLTGVLARLMNELVHHAPGEAHKAVDEVIAR